MKNPVRWKKTLPLTATLIAISAILIAGTNSILAQNSINEVDFKIKEFGLKDGKRG
jgi:hypothetical protein